MFGNTTTVLTVNVAVVAPDATVTVAGTVPFAELDARLMTEPPVGAGPLMVTVPVDALPPITVVGDKLSPMSVGGLIVNVPVTDLPLTVAVIVEVVFAATGVALTVKVPLDEPAGTVKLVGTVALDELELNATDNPAVGAGKVSDTVPVELLPPISDVGARSRLVMLPTVKFVEVVNDPPGPVTVIAPVVAPLGTVAVIEVSETMLNDAVLPLNLTAVAPVKPEPVKVTTVPGQPLVGEKEAVLGETRTTTLSKNHSATLNLFEFRWNPTMIRLPA